MSIDLNIIDRGIQGTDWTPQNTGIQPAQLDKVKEQKTDNSGALNSLPTPFARFFVVQEAFRRVAEDKRSKILKKGADATNAGLAYSRLVSDCLDVLKFFSTRNFMRINGETLRKSSSRNGIERSKWKNSMRRYPCCIML